MKIYFATRTKARELNKKSTKKTRVVDLKQNPNTPRWAVEILK